MKKIIVLILSLFLFGIIRMFGSVSANVSDNILNGIENRIETAMNNCFIKNSIAPLDSISTALDGLGSSNSIVSYWKAYTDYYKSVFYIKLQNKDESEKAIKKAYMLLDKLPEKNSEDYALLALVQSFYIQFVSGMEAGQISSEISGNAEKSLELDSTNIRAWYVLGSNDYYTPVSFGGGKKVETYLQKAISITPQKVNNPYLPTWGKEYAYELLIRYYIQNKQTDKAKTYLSMAEKEFPDSYFIGGYKKQLSSN